MVKEIRGKNGVMRSRYDNSDLPPHILAILAQVERDKTAKQDAKENRGLQSNATNDLREKDDSPTNQNLPLLPPKAQLSEDDYCNALIAHEQGHWEHTTQNTFLAMLQKNPSTRQLLFPKEKEWMKGNDPWQGYGQCKRENNMLTFNGILGHQCGCGVREFQPSLPEWVFDTANPLVSSLDEKSQKTMDSSWMLIHYYKTSATLRLARKLADANATLCFAGDSIDYQIYYGMQNNLKRVSQLHSVHFSGSSTIVNVMDRQIPAKHTTEPGTMDDWYLTGLRPPDGDGSFVNGTRPPPGGCGSMHSILETKVIFKETTGDTGKSKLALIRYFMTYGWSPWVSLAVD